MLTTLQITKIMERSLDEIRLVVHKPTKTDVTNQVKKDRGLILYNSRRWLDESVERSKWSEKIEEALTRNFCGVIGFQTMLNTLEMGIDPKRVSIRDLEIIW